MSNSGANSIDVPENGVAAATPIASAPANKRRAASGASTSSRSTKKPITTSSNLQNSVQETATVTSTPVPTNIDAVEQKQSTIADATLRQSPNPASNEPSLDVDGEAEAEVDEVFSLGVGMMTGSSSSTLASTSSSSASISTSSGSTLSSSGSTLSSSGSTLSSSGSTLSSSGSTSSPWAPAPSAATAAASAANSLPGTLSSSFGGQSSTAAVSTGAVGTTSVTTPATDVATMALPGSGHRDANSQQLLMLAEFSDGYSLRNLIEYLKASNTTTGRLIFSRDRIIFVRSNYQATVLNEVVFRTYDLPRYIYNSDQPTIVFGANMNNIRPITRSIGKKDSARLFMQKGDTRLYIQIISQNAKALSRENVNVIVSQNVEPEGYDLEEYVRSVDRPNCSVPCHDFTKMCGAMNSLKCSYVTAKGFENGMTFIGMIEGNIFGRVDRFGECGSALTLTDLPLQSMSMTAANGPSNSSSATSQPVIRISISIVKALSKINNLTSNGNIRMYFEADRPLKLVCNVGTYGQLNIYLKEEDNNTGGNN